MHKVYFLSCVALTLAVLAEGAPTPHAASETQLQLEHLLLDLGRLLRGVSNYKNSKLSVMLAFKFYVPREANKLNHLQCLAEELKPLEEAVNLAQSKDFTLRDIEELMSNIKVLVLKLKGTETRFKCDYDDEEATVVEFLNKWIIFCQSIFSTLP
ncbi:interleukin-2 [Saccopteryx bilineata]|uniref:interleukin-2 n=1 Tax=Saccopteryx bilineata TaxID=59482 RepID=UPI00338D35FD